MATGGAYSLSQWAALPLPERQQLVRELASSKDGLAKVLNIIRAPKGYGVFASGGPLYSAAIFGRDSLYVADDMLEVMPELSKEIILCLARLQGVRDNNLTEEEPGKIHHEYRLRYFAAARMSPASNKVLDELAAKWGDSHDTLCYYGAVDATPLFVRLVGRYCERYGRQLLQEVVLQRDNQRRTVKQAVEGCMAWLEGQLGQSPWQLLEYRRRNPQGLYNQSWQDSNTAYLHLDGSVANADAGVASVEVQAYTYDALLAGVRICNNHAHADRWRELAAEVRQATLSQLWMEDAGCFASGLDRGQNGQKRQIATLNINAAIVLASGLLEDESLRPYVESLAAMVTSGEFLTEAGVRLRARRHAALLPYADYHGAYVSWPKATFEVARGLRRHGFASEAKELEGRMQRAIIEAGEFYEFFLVDIEGKAKCHYRQQFANEPQFHDLGAANLPEPGQAWTLSAYIASIATKLA